MTEVNVTVSLDGRRGLMEIKDKPYKFKSEERNKDIILNYFQNILNFHTERYPEVCRDYVKKQGYENADYIKLSITGGIFGDQVVTVKSQIGDKDEKEGSTDTGSI